ncbi:hypothetical protein P7C70_g1435, partial [Phenoliferia sp. Uapishka_3]
MSSTSSSSSRTVSPSDSPLTAPSTAPSTRPNTPCSSSTSTQASSPLFNIAQHPTLPYLGTYSRAPLSRGTVVLDEAPLFQLDAPYQAYLYGMVRQGKGPTLSPEAEAEEEADNLDEWLNREILRCLSRPAVGEDERRAFWDLANTADEESEARLLRLRHLKERSSGTRNGGGWSESVKMEVEKLCRAEGLWEAAERLASGGRGAVTLEA